MQNGYVESLNGRMLNESLFFGFDHARSAIAEWADDYNNFRPHSSLGYQTPADYAGIIVATGGNAKLSTCAALGPEPTSAPLWTARSVTKEPTMIFLCVITKICSPGRPGGFP